MVIVKKCCCGLSLYLGSLILLGLNLIKSCFLSLTCLHYLLIRLPGMPMPEYYSELEFKINGFHHLIVNVIGTGIMVEGLYGIEKKSPRHLSNSYYYFCYTAISTGFLIMLMLISPGIFIKCAPMALMNSATNSYTLSAYVVGCLLSMGEEAYFAIVVKSFRDVMIDQTRSVWYIQ